MTNEDTIDGKPIAVFLLDRSDGARRIAEERSRQIGSEGYAPEHDDDHDGGEIADAAACYVTRNRSLWPWDNEPKLAHRPTPAQRVRELEKAGALIAAEIDRLLRAAAHGVRTCQTNAQTPESRAAVDDIVRAASKRLTEGDSNGK